jgi:outer membrane protein assembly factor BamB
VIGGLVLDAAKDTLYATSGKRVFSLRASDLVKRISNRDTAVTTAVLFEAQDEIWSTPVLAGGKLIFASLDGNLYAVNPVSGEEVWHYGASNGLVTSPVVAGNRVLVSGFGSELIAVDVDSGNEAWTYKAGHWVWGRPVLSSSVAYFGAFDGKVYAVNLSNGEEAWVLNLDKGVIRGSPALVGNTLVVSTDKGWLVGIDTRSQAIVWQRDVGTALNGDLTVDGNDVWFAAKGCVTPEDGGDKVYYMKVNAQTGELGIASGVC